MLGSQGEGEDVEPKTVCLRPRQEIDREQFLRIRERGERWL
jgi:hypothetical protein